MKEGRAPPPGFDSRRYERPNKDWECGHARDGCPCRIGPSPSGECRATTECTPRLVLKPGEEKGTWVCTRPADWGGPCGDGPLPDGRCCICSGASTPCRRSCCPSLREERAATYSPFLPIHPRTRIVMQVPLAGYDAEAGTIRWRDPDTNEDFETPVTGGDCKLQWKPDWAMRWYALGVDYEMAGQGPDRLGQAVVADRARARRGRRRRVSTTNCSSTRRGRRSRSRRATA